MFGLMQRLKPTGSHVTSPSQPQAELASTLHRLGALHVFNDEQVAEVYGEIALINGSWMANEESKESPDVANALKALAKSLEVASAVLSGHESGFRSTKEIYATSLIAQNLAIDATIGQAQELITKFRRDARRIVHAALAAHRALSQKSDRDGREALAWYDRFTRLLLYIAKDANIDPTLGNDPINDVPCGWLFEAATELEAFLDPAMRSDSAAGRASRLRRSLKRLGQ
jgi:hypothetical protein